MIKVSLNSLLFSTATVWHSHHQPPYTNISAPFLNTFLPAKQPVVVCNKAKQILCMFENTLVRSNNTSLNLDFNKQLFCQSATNNGVYLVFWEVSTFPLNQSSFLILLGEFLHFDSTDYSFLKVSSSWPHQDTEYISRGPAVLESQIRKNITICISSWQSWSKKSWDPWKNNVGTGWYFPSTDLATLNITSVRKHLQCFSLWNYSSLRFGTEEFRSNLKVS